MRDVQYLAKEIVAREGGFVNDPDDPGGATKYGVTIHTMRRLGLDLTVMVWEDGGYGLIDAHQEKAAADAPQFRFGTPDWGQLAEAFGWSHAPVNGMCDLAQVLKAAHDSTGPTLISVKVDYDAGGGLPRARKAA